MLNGLASYGNAMVNHPGDVLTAFGGMLMMDAGVGGEVLGTGLDATVVGSVLGIPLNVASAGAIAMGAGIAGGAAVDLGRHAATDDRVSPWESRVDKQRSSSSPSTPTDRAKDHLTEKDLDGARRELNGEVVATKTTGTPYDHVAKVQQTQRRLVKRIGELKSALGDTRTAEADRPALHAELSEASELLDHSEQFVPRPSTADWLARGGK